MDAKFNLDIPLDQLNLPPFENYEEARRLARHLTVGNFIDGVWPFLKREISVQEIKLNEMFRSVICRRSSSNKSIPIQVDFSKVTEEDNVFWFRPSECFANVVVPTYLLNSRKSDPTDRYQMIVTSYHAAIFDTEKRIIYDPSIDIVFRLCKEPFSSRGKPIATLALLQTPQGILITPQGLQIGTLTLSEYLHQYHSDGKPLLDAFNTVLGFEAIKPGSIGNDLIRTK